MFNYFYYFIILVQKFSSLTLFGINFFNSLIQTQYYENITGADPGFPVGGGANPPDHVMYFDQ